jgi:hypothetical protein
MIKKYNYETTTQTRTFDNYNDIDCYNYSDVHDYIKFIKHGYGKVTDHVSREIRLRRMSREEGLQNILNYVQNRPLNLDLFLNWIGMTENGFNYMLDQFRNKELWKRNENWEWEFSEHYLSRLKNSFAASNELLRVEDFVDFIETPKKKSTDSPNKYILISKGVDIQ